MAKPPPAPVSKSESAPATGEERRLLQRSGFGVSAGSLVRLREMGWEAYAERQLKPDNADDSELLVRLSRTRLRIEYGGDEGMNAVKQMRGLASLDKPRGELWSGLVAKEKVPGEERRRCLLEVRASTALRAVHSQWQVRELLVDFWHNHFNVYPWEDEQMMALFPAFDRDAIRAHALGNFREMLEAVAQSHAMLVYLNNASSKASPANENYARELFELHTLGADSYLNHLYNRWKSVPGAAEGRPEGYIDQDVYEAARAFTGWTIADGRDDGKGGQFPNTGEFHVAAAWHDPYQKRILATEFDANQPPLADGRRVLDLVAAHPATALHLCTKLCRRFLADEPPAALVARIAKVWTENLKAPDQVARVIRAILLSPEFRTLPETKVKRPFELAASFLRGIGAELHPSNEFFDRLESCGQPLFGWLPPTGFPDRSSYWLSNRFMMDRWNLVWGILNGDLDCGRVDVIRPAEAAGVASARDFATFWARQLLGSPLEPAREKALLEKVCPEMSPDEPMDWLSGDTRALAMHTVALLAMAPQFQYR